MAARAKALSFVILVMAWVLFGGVTPYAVDCSRAFQAVASDETLANTRCAQTDCTEQCELNAEIPGCENETTAHGDPACDPATFNGQVWVADGTCECGL
jgi:hypothetical protein